MVSLLGSRGGLASAGSTAKYFISSVAFKNSARASLTSSGLGRESRIAPASTLAPSTMAFWALWLVGVTAACQLWYSIPGTLAGKLSPALGTTQVTSPLSLEEAAWRR